MGRQRRSLRSKAVHFVSDLTTVLLNPISDKPSKTPAAPPIPFQHIQNAILGDEYQEDEVESEGSQLESISEEGCEVSVDGPDTSSFTAFLRSLLSSSDPGDDCVIEEKDGHTAESTDLEPEPGNIGRGNGGKKSLFSRGKQSLGKSIHCAARFGGYRNQASDKNGDSEGRIGGENVHKVDGEELRPVGGEDSLSLVDLPEMSEHSLLLLEKTRSTLYVSLPSLIKGKKWVLLYSTWSHGISLSTLYRRSQLCPGLSLLVVGDRKGAVFGGLVEAPLRPTRTRKYQGTNSTFVFTDLSGHPDIFCPTGANRYFTLCSADFLALGGGSHFALYLDGDLLNGSSLASETYGNCCLAHSQDFEVKEVELWGFVYASKYEEMLALCRKKAPGICRW